MNKLELVQRNVLGGQGVSAQSAQTLKSLVAALRETLREGGKIFLSGLGTFKVKARKAGGAHNPVTGERLPIPAGRKISFRPSLSLRTLVKG